MTSLHAALGESENSRMLLTASLQRAAFHANGKEWKETIRGLAPKRAREKEAGGAEESKRRIQELWPGSRKKG